MSKELFVTSTPHETKLAVVEEDQVVEVFFERENEYTLAGSIYKGRVTRVLPGMQSAFVDIGLDRDAFLYVTDFLEEVEDSDEVDVTPKPTQVVGEANDRAKQGVGRDRNQREKRGHRRPEQHRAAQAAGSQPAPPSFSIEGGNVEGPVESEMEERTVDEAAEVSSQPVDPSTDRNPRRWRGRRGRRRGRSLLNEAKYAPSDESAESAGVSAAGSDESASHGVQDSSAEVAQSQPSQAIHDDSTEKVAAETFEQQQVVSEEEKSSRVRQQTPPRPRAPQRQQRILLPGESLAKYNPKTESASANTESSAGVVESRFQKVAPRPSTEVSVPQGALSASHGILQGESLAKYRNRPAEVDREEKEIPAAQEESTPIAPQQHRPSDFSENAAPLAFPQEAKQKNHAEAAHNPRVEFQTTKGLGDYNFSPGTGVIEEEEITEEEHDPSLDANPSTQRDEGEYEELEEETLDMDGDDKESHVIAAGEGLAAALAESREPVKPVSYTGEDPEEDEEDESEDRSEDDFGTQEEEFEDDEVLADGEQEHGGEEVELSDADPDDPNYSGRAELRTPADTAGFTQQQQQRSDRGAERKRGSRRGRPQRSPGRGGGGPRRNIPRGPMPQINDLLKEGQEILVQIAKEPMAKKGARITSHIALPGRFLVFMPTVNHTGVSRKIGSEEERHRLKRILISEKGQAHGGFIVRTAASGASEEDLRADIRFLINLWNEIKQRAETSKAPALIYHDLNLVERILRDQVTTTFSQIWVDNEPEYERIVRFASRFQPSLVRRVKLYTKETPLFEEFNVQEEINKALKSKVWLKSGGYIVINQTEALVAIDINTGKYVGKTARLEDTIVKTNIDAIKEIVRQIRLRDLGGIIVIDFIDMDERKNRQKVMQALEEALKSDRSPSKVLQFNDFGLVAITRKRVKQSLERTLGTQCTYCTGTGMIKSVTTVCNEIYVELRKMARHLDGSQVTLRVNPEVGKALKEAGGKWLLEMEELTKKTIIVKSDLAQHQEQFDIH